MGYGNNYDDANLCDELRIGSMSKVVTPVQQFSIWPNPTWDMIQVESENAMKEVRSYSASGSLVLKWSLSDHFSRLNLAPTASGIYIVDVLFESGGCQSQRIIISNNR
ncbi:MAG: hypothetical protein DRI69_10260 [Bacteroidetes bacterium]|nr:MAG: hypothetical protein DRI69_10260 [Bacteroidota bacterium]